MKYYQTINLENLHRPRLMKLLDKCMEFPLIFMEAGTGFGKSITVNQYLDSRQNEYALVRLSKLDNLPEQFWAKYTRALSKLNPEAAEELSTLGFPFTHSEISNCLHIITKSINVQENAFFILDGFHLITEPSILHFVECMIHVEIDLLHIIIISAQKHGLNVNALYQADLIASITEKDLCFTKEEIAEYLRLLQVSATPELIDWIHYFSEGWAFAIKLMLSYLKNNVSTEELSTMVLPTIFDLMETFAYKSYSQSFRDVLVALSFLHIMPIKLAMSITGLNYEEIISLQESNPFIRFDAGTASIEIHNVYLQFLRSKRSYVAKETLDKFQTKIAEWFYDNGYIYEALDAYKNCQEYDKVCQIIREFKNRKISYDTSAYLLKTLQGIPRETMQAYPDMPLYQALFYFNNNELCQALELLDNYEAALLNPDPEADLDHQLLLGECYLLKGITRLFQKEADFYLYFQKADKLLTEGSTLFDHTYPLLEINHGLLCKSLSTKDLEDSFKALDAGFPLFVKLTHGCGAGLVELSYGEFEFLKGNYRIAEKHLYEALFQARDHFQGDIVITIYYILLRIGIARGNPDMAMEYIEKIKDFRNQPGYPKRDYPLIDIALSWISLKIGSAVNIPNWLVDGEVSLNEISKRNEGRNLTIYAHWLLAIKQSPAEALAYIEKVEKAFIERSITTSLIYLYQLKYTALKMLDRPAEECFQLIETIYDLIHESETIMFIVENGSSTRSALLAYKKYKNKRIPDEWVDRVITKAMTYSKYLNTFKLKYQKSNNCLPDMTLTNNEKALLDGLCFGLSRAEIAEENRITENTVKSQLKTIYNKLNATNQAEAVYIYTTLYLTNS